MDPSDLFPTHPFSSGGPPIQSAPSGALDPTDLMARLLAAYPSQVYEGWSPAPPSPEAAASADPLTQLGLSQLYPDLFGHLGTSAAGQDGQDEGSGGWLTAGAQATAQGATRWSGTGVWGPPNAGVVPGDAGQDVNAPGDTGGDPDAGTMQSASQPGTLQLAPTTPVRLTPAPQLANVSDNGLEFTPTYPGVSGPAAFGRIGLQRDGSGFQNLGGLATPGHATPGQQILRDSQTPTASVNVSSPSADEISVMPVVQNGRLQMAIYDDTTREKWVVDSTPGQSTTVHNAKGEPIVFTSTDLTAANDRPRNNPFAEFGSGMADSEADQNTLSLRPGRGVWHNLGYQEGKVEAALGLAAPIKDLAALGGGKLAAIAGIGRAAEDGSLTGPVIFRHVPNATTEEMEQLRAYVASANDALKEGRILPTGRVAVSKTLRRSANNLAARERTRAARAGTPYQGQVGHAPDVTWTGDAGPYRWQDTSPRLNASIGGQSRRYPRGFKPTEFRVEGE